jgi:ABC-type phosphate/phosphonate transport system ATPase subunit
MKLTKLRIQNFRLFSDQTIGLGDYTCLVGPNGAGKSTVLTALNIFFRETVNTATDIVNLSEEDFHNRNTKEPIRITITFTELSAEAQEDLKAYYRQGELTVTAVAEFDSHTKIAQVKQYGQRLGMASFRLFFDKMKIDAPAKELNEIYEQLRMSLADLPKATSKPAKMEALQAYESAHSRTVRSYRK